MTLSTSQLRRGEQGFTLVELAIVMIIIGLLIGGILKGQELINNAKVSSAVTQIKGLEAAANTFKEKYAALPGDILAPNTRLPNCGAAVCNVAGNGDSQIDATDLGAAQATPVAGTNETQIFAHLAAANLLTGDVQPTVAWSLQTSYPNFTLGGKVRLGYVVGGQTGAIAAIPVNAHYIAVGNGGGAMGASELPGGDLANIDRKLDDGMPNTGSVMAVGNAAANTCTILGTGVVTDTYDEAANSRTCGIFVRIFN
jgi:prepilin-type N-terminal cleavage/methylation domain-containing protein